MSEIDIPPEELVLHASGCERRASGFAQDDRRTTEANQLFQSYRTYLNILVAEARSAEDIGLGAQMSACPWKLGMRS